MLHGTEVLKKGFAKMTKGGVIMDVVNAEQAVIAEESGAVSVMALREYHLIYVQQVVLQEWLILLKLLR